MRLPLPPVERAHDADPVGARGPYGEPRTGLPATRAGVCSEEAVEREEAPREAPAPPDPTPDIFVPSEDISEDLSVRFPVDI